LQQLPETVIAAATAAAPADAQVLLLLVLLLDPYTLWHTISLHSLV